MSKPADRQKQLLEFLDRRHPEYVAMKVHWEFLEDTYKGGRHWFAKNIHRYIKEGIQEYADRVSRAYRFNHTREVVDLVDKYIFKMEIRRDDSRAPDAVKTFWKNSTLTGLSMQELAKIISNRSSVFGRPWIVVDSSSGADGKPVITKKDEKGLRIYAYVVEPGDVLDMSYDDKGALNWILIHETIRDDTDPLASSGKIIHRFRLWTREASQLFTVKVDGRGKRVVIEDPEVPHSLGEVPVVPGDNTINTGSLYTSPAMIADTAYLDRACANYLSNLDAIIQDQTFSQLAMPAQGIAAGDDGGTKLREVGTNRIFTFDAEAGIAPFFLSPDVRQAELILKAISKIINEIYHSIGLAGERTKEDNSQGIDNSSGVAKAYDFERVNSLLAAKASSLQWIENRIAHLVALYAGEERRLPEGRDLVSYPDNFDVRGLYDEFEIAARLAMVEAPDSMRREQMQTVADKLFPQLREELRTKIEAELKTWPPKVDLAAGARATEGKAVLKGQNGKALADALVKGNAGKV